MGQGLTYLMAGLMLMRQSPGLYLALITASAALNYYALATPGWMMLGILFSFFFYYWCMSLAAQQVSGAQGGLLDFLQPRSAPLLGIILYPFFAMLWAVLVSLPVWLIGSFVGGAMFGRHLGIDESTVEGRSPAEVAAEMSPEQMSEGMESMIQSGEFLWVLAGMMIFSFVFYFRFLSNRITVPIAAAIWGESLADADRHCGPQSGQKYRPLFWVFLIPTLPVWTLSLFIFQIIPADSGAMLLFDFALSFATAWPLVAAVAFVQQEIGAPPRGHS